MWFKKSKFFYLKSFARYLKSGREYCIFVRDILKYNVLSYYFCKAWPRVMHYYVKFKIIFIIYLWERERNGMKFKWSFSWVHFNSLCLTVD